MHNHGGCFFIYMSQKSIITKFSKDLKNPNIQTKF